MKKVFALIFCAAFMLALGWAQEGAAQGKASANTFKDQGLGYSISYPNDWTYAYQAPHIVVFSARKGPHGGALISLRNLNSTKTPGGKYKDSDAVLEALMNQLKRAKDVILYEPEPFLYNKGGIKLTGTQVTAEYSIKGEKYKQWVVVLPRAGGDVFHMWSLVAPAKSYDAVSQAARAMLNSWVIQ